MNKHTFKIENTAEEFVYRIVDETDNSIVGITDCYRQKDKRVRRWDIQDERDDKSKHLYAKVIGYDIVVNLDKDSAALTEGADYEYIRNVLWQMAIYFKAEVIDKNPERFSEFYVTATSPVTRAYMPKRKKRTVEKDTSTIVILLVVKLLFLIPAFFLLKFLLQYGIGGVIVFIIGALAFLPEILAI